MNHLIQPLEARRLMSVTTPIAFSTIIDEPVSEYANVSQQVRIAYMPKLSVGHLSQLHGDIIWGDGISSPAGFDHNKNGGIDIIGTHDYTKAGTFSITTGPISETGWAPPGDPVPQFIVNLGSVKTTATVAATPAQLTETAGKKFTATLGTFNQETLDIFFTATINWGDGVTSTGTVTGGDLDQGNWTITGTHLYKSAGTYKVHAYVYSHLAPHGKGYLAQDLFILIHVVKP
jgi:hypothetical protein